MESERSHTIEQMADVVHTALRAMHSRHNKQEFTQNCYLFQHPLTVTVEHEPRSDHAILVASLQ